jgi:hypothetical protein
MAYSPVKGRKPTERASKISHADVINNPEVQAFLANCTVPRPAEVGAISDLLTEILEPTDRRIRAVVAIDGSFREVPIQERYPSATITFFTFGPLLLKLQDLAELDSCPFLAPEDMARLKRIQRYSLVLPTRNISLEGKTLTRSVRDTLHRFFATRWNNEPPFYDALRWLLFRRWIPASTATWTLAHCPNPACTQAQIVLTHTLPNQTPCPTCGEPIYLIDALRLHEAVDDDHGAGGILSYVMTGLEQIALVHVVKLVWDMQPQLLRELLFVKDGPLAFFGQTAPLCQPMKELAAFLHCQPDPKRGANATTSLLNAVGLEKSGAFVGHAIQLEDRITPGNALILNNDYIYHYVVPGDPNNPHPYGANTYWGGKLIYRAQDRNVYVATVPTGMFKPHPKIDDFPNLAEILSVVSSLKCSMYDNALVPIALANKLVSLSDFPSSRILEAFARGQVSRPT